MKDKGVLFFLPVGELHIQRSISLVTNHVVQGLPRTFRVRQGQVTPGSGKIRISCIRPGQLTSGEGLLLFYEYSQSSHLLAILAAGMGFGHPGTIATGSFWKSLYLDCHEQKYMMKVISTSSNPSWTAHPQLCYAPSPQSEHGASGHKRTNFHA